MQSTMNAGLLNYTLIMLKPVKPRHTALDTERIFLYHLWHSLEGWSQCGEMGSQRSG